MDRVTYFLVRIIPTKLVAPDTFRSALSNITITAYDKTVQTAGTDRTLGSAKDLAPLPHPQDPLIPPLEIDGSPPRLKTSIIQHVRPPTRTSLSVATAVIVVDPRQIRSDAEYPTPTSFDISLKISLTNGSGNPRAIVRTKTVDYNIKTTTESLNNTQYYYTGAKTDIYLSLDVPDEPLADGTTVLFPREDGNPPSFEILSLAVNGVLRKDHPPGAPSLEAMTAFLSTAECQQIAAELVNNRTIDPPPQAPYPTAAADGMRAPIVFEDLYTLGAVEDNEAKQARDMDRQKFEGERTSYYAVHQSSALQLANHIFSLVTAVQAEQYIYQQGRMASIEIPIKESVSHTTGRSAPQLSLIGSPLALNPPFIVPAAFLYALTTSYAISQSVETRIQVLLTSSEDTLRSLLQQAIDAEVLHSPDSDGYVYENSTLTNIPSTSINQHQAIRRLVALQPFVQSAPDRFVQLAGNADMVSLVTSWLDFRGPDRNIIDTFWRPLFSTRRYLVAILEIIAPNQEALITGIFQSLHTPSNNLVETVDDLLQVSDQGWLDFFKANETLLPSRYILGDLDARVRAFMVDVRKIIFIPGTGTVPVPVEPSNVPFLDGSFERDVLVRFFASFSAFSFSNPMDSSMRQQIYDAALGLFEASTCVASFVTKAVESLWTLFNVTKLELQPSLRFSYMEALYARGFTTVGSILQLSEASFTRALIGTVAFARASGIYAAAKTLPWDPDDGDTPPGINFRPINSGSLIDCIPPEHLSPFSPIQYLHDLLELADGEQTLQNVLKPRRGDLGSLLVTHANGDLALPIIDIVNENLENFALGFVQEANERKVFNTLDNGLTELDLPGVNPLEVADSLSATDLLRALPQHSSPHLSTGQTIYERLKTEVRHYELPYSQGLDIGRTYLRALGTSRFETLRIFQEQITELPHDASHEPADFQSHLWRLPVRKPIAMEYLCISLEEASLVFGGKMSASTVMQMLGLSGEQPPSRNAISQVTFFLRVTGLSYCEFLELHKSGIVAFKPDTSNEARDFPSCLPCCAEDLRIDWASENSLGSMVKALIFTRLWRRLQNRSNSPISMAVLADICHVLHLFNDSNVNPGFLVQLSSLLMLKEMWNLPWTNPIDSTVDRTQPDQRTQLLALWSGAGAGTQNRDWAINALLNAVERYSMEEFHCPKRPASWRKIIAKNLDEVASLAGFHQETQSWDARPTCTIRFVEVLSKIYASNFTVGELVFLFTNAPHLRGDDPFAITEEDESLDDPLNVPEDDDVHGLWGLRRKLLDVAIAEDEAFRWTWGNVEATLRKMGFHEQFDQYGVSFGERFFPEILEAEGHNVGPTASRFEVEMQQGSSSPLTWLRAGECSPFHLQARDEGSLVLWTRLPLRDDDVLHALRELPQLNSAESKAVQRLYLAPRGVLTPFAFIFSNFGRAAEYLIQEPCVYKRWGFFQHEFALFLRRCRVIAHHIHDAVVATISTDSHECHCIDKDNLECAGSKVAWEIILRLIADGNRAQSSWEDDSGARPLEFDVSPQLTGGAFAALLGLTGIGLLGEYNGSYNASWKETRGGLSGWGTANNYWNSPVVTILPRLDIRTTQEQSAFASFKNGFALNQDTGDLLSGAEPFAVTFSGVLLIENDGCYHFAMRCPKHCGDEDDACHCEKSKQWFVTLQRGQKTWWVLEQGSDEDRLTHKGDVPSRYSRSISLRRGAYDLVLNYHQPEPNFDDSDDLHRFHTGFVLKYKGPDTSDRLVEVPHSNLYLKDQSGRIGYNDRKHAYYNGGVYERYLTSLRDIRRTYQRAFKSILFAHRFCLSACRSACGWESELGFLLSQPNKFQGVSYYVNDGIFRAHRADLDFNLLPVGDAYSPPPVEVDHRVEPSWKRSAALFDWFERIFDYSRLKRWVREVCEPPVWLLFYHADADSRQSVSQLMRFLDIDIALGGLALEYFQPQTGGFWRITDTENISALTDERWTTRVWLAGRFVEQLKQIFYAPTAEIARCRPALWASSPDGNFIVNGTTGNANLTRFVQRSTLSQTDAPPRLNLVVELSNGLRIRARAALLAYLAGHNRSATSLSEELLLDTEVGIEVTTSRVDEAIGTVQRFMQRAILGLESSVFHPSQALRKRWDCEISSFEKWQAAQRRKWYYENWIHWEESAKTFKSEGFRSLKRLLGSDVSTLPRSEKPLFWTREDLPSLPGISSVGNTESFNFRDHSNALDEGLRLLGTPDHSARPTWLATAPVAEAKPDPPDDGPQIPQQISPKLTPMSNATSSLELSQTLAALPGAEALDHIPMWIQAAVRLGARFVRVAASGMPVAAPYMSTESSSPCCICKRDHAPMMDEYYFWLEDARRYDPSDTPAPQNADLHENTKTPEFDAPIAQGRHLDPRTREADPTSDWDAPTPRMLSWKSQPLVHLRWTRVHMGVLLDPRRSNEGIALTESQISTTKLDVVGRTFDSLVFSLFAQDQALGFRYDIATDSVVVLPEAVTSTGPPALPLPESIASDLTAFPYFLYFEPGAPLVPVDTFSTSLVVAASLRADCHFLEASEWLRLAFDPLARDNSWMQCKSAVTPQLSASKESKMNETPESGNIFSIVLANGGFHEDATTTDSTAADAPCCPSAPVKSAKAQARAATLEYLETLYEWANSLFSGNSLERSHQALTILSTMQHIMGPRPEKIMAKDKTGGTMTIASFVSYAPPLNHRLVQLYYRTSGTLESIRTSLNKRYLRNGETGRDLARFGSHTRFDLEPGHAISEECESSCNFPCGHPYRFSSILLKALQWVGLAKASASALQTAIEKADAEALSSLRLAQERQMTELVLEISKNQYRAADWEVQALDKQMAHAITRLQYYQRLIELGLNTGELGHVAATTASMASRTSATIIDGVGQGMAAVPDMWVGIAGVAGSPLQFNQIPVGNKLGTGFAAAARILNTVADISATSAGLVLTQSGWDRREDEWQHTCDLTVLEIQQIKRQRLAARRRLDTALKELDNTQRRIEHSAEVQDFSRDKTSRYELYLYLQQENAALYRQSYELALQTAREAQSALRFELGDASLSYLFNEHESWNSLHERLLAGDKLELALGAMERAHLSKHCREYELTKHVSLRLHFPAAFVMLKATGFCEIDLPEWLFDLDFPSHYMRRIKAVSLTVPCVAGPYTGVHCKLQQLSSSIRFRPLRNFKDSCKCCHKRPDKKQTSPLPTPCLNDPHIWRRYAGTESIATSTGQSDSGLFELAFTDPRYLPFEYTGAVSRWRIELPPENNQFDFDSLSDLIMHINYTAREGGDEFGREGNTIAQKFLPGGGWRFFDLRHELPEAWNVVRRKAVCERCEWKQHDACKSPKSCNCAKHESNKLSGHCHEVGRGNDHWCEKCQLDHHVDDDRHDRQSNYSHEEHGSSHEERGQHHGKVGTKKKRPTHSRREFRLALTRDRFPFLTGRRTVSITSIHLIIQAEDCDFHSSKLRFIPRLRHHQGRDCVVTEDIPLVLAEGGVLKGSLVLREPVELPDRDFDAQKLGDGGLIGTFSLPCELKNTVFQLLAPPNKNYTTGAIPPPLEESFPKDFQFVQKRATGHSFCGCGFNLNHGDCDAAVADLKEQVSRAGTLWLGGGLCWYSIRGAAVAFICNHNSGTNTNAFHTEHISLSASLDRGSETPNVAKLGTPINGLGFIVLGFPKPHVACTAKTSTRSGGLDRC
ncbi:insecticidal toxin complex protein [Paramyrothecium foliicola]|nr:insecticidal toxin complex protein [Paramyrothecium foliicola]